ncbi:hypothetical protein LCGC14_1949240, partial [marine sediment metagenome]
FELEKKWFDLNTEYENYGNSESSLFLEDDDKRKEAREKLKLDNPDWIADLARIEAIDHDASDAIVEKWAEREKETIEFGSSSAEAKVWLIDNPEVHEWALEQKLLEDDGSDWNEPVLRINVEWAVQDEEYYNGISTRFESIENLDLRADKITQAREQYYIENPEYYKAVYRRDAHSYVGPAPDYKHFPVELKDKNGNLLLDLYVQYFTDPDLKKPEDWDDKLGWYEDNWFLEENIEFYRAMLDIGRWKKGYANFPDMPPREVFDLWLEYNFLPTGFIRKDFRLKHPELDAWGVLMGKWKPAEGEISDAEGLSQWEKTAKRGADLLKRAGELGK